MKKAETLGRFPANLALDPAAAAELGRQSGELNSHGGGRRLTGNLWTYGDYNGANIGAKIPKGDTGTAARFFFRYSPRANRDERIRGCDLYHWRGDPDHPEGWRRVTVEEWQHIPRRQQVVGTNHPTLTPLEMARYLARLILPPIGLAGVRERTTGSRGRVLVPFSGVLSEAIGTGLAGWPEVVAIEQSPSYVEQGACRWRAWGPYSEVRAESIDRQGGLREEQHHPAQGNLFEAAP